MGQIQSNDTLEIKTPQVKRQTKSSLVSDPKISVIENTKSVDDNVNKRKFIRLGTIRRKLARSLRTGKASDYRRHIRDLLQTWTTKQIESFLKEYESLEALKELKINSDRARPKPLNLSKSFEVFYKEKVCSDLILEYGDKPYEVHKSILCTRSSYLKDLIVKHKSNKDPIKIEKVDNVRSSLFDSLLLYLYSDITIDEELTQILPTLGKTFGKLRSLKEDLQDLSKTDENTDVLLVFHNAVNIIDNGSNGSIENLFEIPCHSSVLCARSGFFKALLKSKFNEGNNTLPVKLVLSETILPKPYVKIILHCMYTDTLDLSSVIKWKVADDGTGEADRLLTTAELAMELYETGHFLDFPQLMQECEDVIVDNFNVSTLLGVLEWSSQPHGSKYVQRQAFNFFLEEFSTLCKTPLFLANIPRRFFLEAVKSDFLQANEEFILASIIKWGEWQTVRTNEKKGTSPMNSLPRRSPKRKDINNETLLEMTADLLSMVRVKHVLPASSSVLQSAYQRGLLQRPFPFDVVANEKHPPSVLYWVREFRHPEYMRPRLFMHYYYETKLILYERLSSETDTGNCSGSHTNLAHSYSNRMPDMLPTHQTNDQTKQLQNDDIIRHNNGSLLDIMQLDNETIRNIILREKELKTSQTALQALAVAPDHCEISEQIQLQVVREFGLPDEIALEIFQQRPDLIEDSGSNSSKHSTLTKVGYLLREDSPKRLKTGENDVNAGSVIVPDQVDFEPMDLVSSTQESMQQNYSGNSDDNELNKLDIASNISPTKVIDDSPLDLPIQSNSVRSVEQDLLAGINNYSLGDS